MSKLRLTFYRAAPNSGPADLDRSEPVEVEELESVGPVLVAETGRNIAQQGRHGGWITTDGQEWTGWIAEPCAEIEFGPWPAGAVACHTCSGSGREDIFGETPCRDCDGKGYDLPDEGPDFPAAQREREKFTPGGVYDGVAESKPLNEEAKEALRRAEQAVRESGGSVTVVGTPEPAPGELTGAAAEKAESLLRELEVTEARHHVRLTHEDPDMHLNLHSHYCLTCRASWVCYGEGCAGDAGGDLDCGMHEEAAR